MNKEIIDEDYVEKEMWEIASDSEKQITEISRQSYTYFQDAIRRLKKNKIAIFGMIVIIIIALLSIIVPMISKYNYDDQNLDFFNLPLELEIIKLGENNYVHIADGLRVIKMSERGDVIELLEPMEEDLMNKRKVYECKGEKFILDFNDKSVKLLDEQGNRYHEAKEVHNRTYIFGSDKLGRDILVRLTYGARISLSIALIATIVNMIIGVLYGGISAYFGGMVDNIMIRIVDIISTVPLMLYIIILMVVIGPGFKTIVIAMGSVFWVGTARLVRGEILRLKSEEYTLAAKSIGASDLRILLRHLLPNAMGPIIVCLTFMIPDAIFTEAFLSFIGLGIPAPSPSWGTLCENAIEGYRTYPYQLFLPAVAISITILCFNFLGDGFRDAFDPKLRK